ncbi:hypothetical protein ACFL6X_06140 [Candidatus Latescibacterota bacterium]
MPALITARTEEAAGVARAKEPIIHGVPFMVSSIVTGLMRAWEELGDQTARQLCINGCRLLTRLTTREGLMYYKEAPITRTGPHNSSLLNMRPLGAADLRAGGIAEGVGGSGR